MPPLVALEPVEEFERGLGGAPVLTDWPENDGLCEC